MTVRSLPRHPWFRRTPKISLILLRGQAPQPELAAPLKDFVDGEVPFEDEVAAVLDLGDGVEARQVHAAALLLGELRSQDERPVVELLADDLRAEPVGGGLQRRDIVDGQEGVVVFAKADLLSVQFLLHERVAVEPVRGLEREERGHAHDDRPEDFIADVEVVMGEAAASDAPECGGWGPGWGTSAR